MGRIFSPRFDNDGNVAGMAVSGATSGRELDAAGQQRVAELIRLNEPDAAVQKPAAAAPVRKPGFDPGLNS